MMNIRPMTIEDFGMCYQLWQRANLHVEPFDEKKKEVAMMIEKNPTSCLVGIENNNIIGTSMGVFNGRRAWIYHLAVDPAFQHKGYGSQLLKATEEELKKAGAPVVLLFVDNDNLEIVPFYTKKGYSDFNNSIVLRKVL